MYPRRLKLGILISCLAFLVEAAAGQQDAGSSIPTVIIPGDPDCLVCSVRLEHVVSLGDSGDSSSVVPWSTLARNSRGEYYVAPVAHPGEIYVYGPDGTYRTKVGRAGQGPGEYSARTKVAVGMSDSVHVIDTDLRRWTVLGPNHEVARTAPLPGYVRRFFVTSAGDLLLHADVNDERCFGLPLQLLAPDGRVEGCFGAYGGVIRRDRPHSLMRQVADAGGGLIWSARVNRYEVDLLDAEGDVHRRIVRAVDWFEPWEQDAPGAFVEVPPRPRVMGVTAVEAGRLLTFVSVPDENWEAPPPDASREVTAALLDRHFDAVVEVLDPSEGRVLASVRFSTQIRPTEDGSLAYSFSEHVAGDTRMDVWRVLLQDARSRHPIKRK